MNTLGDSLSDGWWMFWETLWALVLGFVLSGAVQAFVSRRAMQRSLGDHRPASIARAGFFGAVSSSCSYAASALARTLFVRGADFTAAQAFMFASTNLVVELGIVLWLLLGWQFAAAEFVGGGLMVTMLGVVLPRVVPARLVNPLRDRESHGGHEHGSASTDSTSWRQRVRTRAGWSDAAGFTLADLTMLRKELVIGFVVAGFADVAVPTSWWRALFVTGHGFWSAVENAVLGPFLAMISFVCSVGNVPLAAALWSSGIGFAGVVAFVFGDLLALPLLLIYRRYYGTPVTLRLVAVFWATMSLAALVTEGLFRAAGLVPTDRFTGEVGTGRFGLNATTILDLIALAGFAVIVWLARTRVVTDDSPYATDPVCGMQVEKAHPGATAVVDGVTVYFCCDGCRDRHVGDAPAVAAPVMMEFLPLGGGSRPPEASDGGHGDTHG